MLIWFGCLAVPAARAAPLVDASEAEAARDVAAWPSLELTPPVVPAALLRRIDSLAVASGWEGEQPLDSEELAAMRVAFSASVLLLVDGHAASGVNLRTDGLVLTNAHVPERLDAVGHAEFPDGRGYPFRCVKLDNRQDLALLVLAGAGGLAVASIAGGPAEAGDAVVVIGQPLNRHGGVNAFAVITGNILGFAPNRLKNLPLGAVAHDAPTNWGNSGSPLLNRDGEIVGLHNTWNPRTEVRHAVSWEAIRAFVGGDTLR